MGKNGVRIFTSESVTEGHPDKMCDKISDAILDACLDGDKLSRVACECFAGKDYLLIGGEITTKAVVDYEKVARDTIKNIGYTIDNAGFKWDTVKIDVRINEQSPDIALGTNDVVNGAGDQGMMFGFASKDTSEYMPAPIVYAHNIAKELAHYRKNSELGQVFMLPDGKAQVSVEYKDGIVKRIDTIVVSSQHTEECMKETLDGMIKGVLKKAIDPGLIDKDTEILINPTGRFVIGGPQGDTGLTGRKVIVDTYGGMGRHGGGAFSGKDATKVDRSGAYMARYLAKNIVAAGLADKCEVQLAYAIGVKWPAAVYVDTFGTSVIDEENIIQTIIENFDLSPLGIIEKLKLREQRYSELASYGHLGREDVDTEWEKLDSVSIFKSLL